MIVRINQFEAARPEAEAGWPADGRLGPPLSESFRQVQMRQIIPHAVAALREPGEDAVVRLDGPIADRELLPAYRYLAGEHGEIRYSLSEAQKLDAAPAEVPHDTAHRPPADPSRCP